MVRKYLGRVILGSIASTVLFFAAVTAEAGSPPKPPPPPPPPPPIPIVLVHGLFGGSKVYSPQLGLAWDYWWGIKADLESNGNVVYVPSIPAADDEIARGERLIAYLEDKAAQYGYKKFNLIGHSQGGLSARYAAHYRPGLIASVTTVGTPNYGSSVADWKRWLLDTQGDQKWVQDIKSGAEQAATGAELASGVRYPVNVINALNQLTTDTVSNKFNRDKGEGKPTSYCGVGPEIASNGVRYYSFGGITPTWTPVTHLLDLGDWVMLNPDWPAWGWADVSGRNDGEVSQCSTHWGVVMRDDFAWNHLDLVNQLWGLIPWFTGNPVEMYRNHVRFLRNRGM